MNRDERNWRPTISHADKFKPRVKRTVNDTSQDDAMDKAPGGPKVPRKKKVPGFLRVGAKKHAGAKKKKKVAVVFKFREFRVTQPVDMKNYVMEYTIPNEQVMEFRKNKIKYANNPKLEVRDSKASTLKDEFSGWCGRKQGIKNWLYYV